MTPYHRFPIMENDPSRVLVDEWDTFFIECRLCPVYLQVNGPVYPPLSIVDILLAHRQACMTSITLSYRHRAMTVWNIEVFYGWDRNTRFEK